MKGRHCDGLWGLIKSFCHVCLFDIKGMQHFDDHKAFAVESQIFPKLTNAAQSQPRATDTNGATVSIKAEIAMMGLVRTSQENG